MQIELLGLPGSGKSTYVKKMSEENSNLNLLMESLLYSESRIRRNLNKLYLALRFAILDYKEFHKLILFFKKIKFISFKRKIKMFLYASSILEIILLAKKDSLYKINMMDEGLCQVVWGICYNVKPYDRPKALLLFEIFEEYIADEILIFNIDINTIRRRLLQRNELGGSELQHEIRQNSNAIIIAQEILDEIMIYLTNNYRSRIKFWRE